MIATILTTSSYLPDAHQRVQNDLIEAERKQRTAAERLARELARVLQELAIIFDGERLETMRREDPKIPLYWTPDDWRIFFAGVASPKVKSGWGQADDGQRQAELERTVAELKARLTQMEKTATDPSTCSGQRPSTRSGQRPSTLLRAGDRPQTDLSSVVAHPPSRASRATPRQTETHPASPPAKARPGSPQPAVFAVPDEMTPPLGSLLASAREAWSTIPSTCPAAFNTAISGKGRSGEDLKRAYQRYFLALYLVGGCHLNAKLEIEDLLAMTSGLASRAGSLSRIIEELLEAGILAGEIVRLGSPKTSLRLVRLSPDGVRLFKILFDQEPGEGDWEHLIRLHEGERFPEHTLAVLIFAMHARKRGWATQVLPPVENTKAVPDLLVLREAERWYIEVELGQKENGNKWRNQAKLNASTSPGAGSGKVALCAATPATRQRLVGDCRLAKLRGLATDLETLVQVKYSTITDQTPLWAESW